MSTTSRPNGQKRGSNPTPTQQHLQSSWKFPSDLWVSKWRVLAVSATHVCQPLPGFESCPVVWICSEEVYFPVRHFSVRPFSDPLYQGLNETRCNIFFTVSFTPDTMPHTSKHGKLKTDKGRTEWMHVPWVLSPLGRGSPGLSINSFLMWFLNFQIPPHTPGNSTLIGCPISKYHP